MKQADLITGLLGAGKTTFLAAYVRFLRGRGENPAVIVNDHGAVSVDSVLLRETLGDGVRVETVIDDGGPGCHKRRVRAKLIALAMEGFSRVVIEPSGVFEPEEFFDMLREDPLDRWYEPGNVIAILEAGTEKLSPASRFLLASQLADAGAVLLSKTEKAGPAGIEAALAEANAALAEFKCARRLGEDVIRKPWADFTPVEWERLAACGVRAHDYERRAPAQLSFRTLYFLNTDRTRADLPAVLGALFSGDYGKVLRVKGFLPGDGGWVRFNATPGETEILPTACEQRCFIVIGEALNQEALERFIAGDGPAKIPS